MARQPRPGSTNGSAPKGDPYIVSESYGNFEQASANVINIGMYVLLYRVSLTIKKVLHQVFKLKKLASSGTQVVTYKYRHGTFFFFLHLPSADKKEGLIYRYRYFLPLLSPKLTIYAPMIYTAPCVRF
jgi:hypothetical protein